MSASSALIWVATVGSGGAVLGSTATRQPSVNSQVLWLLQGWGLSWLMRVALRSTASA
jgi:hypothetical protein